MPGSEIDIRAAVDQEALATERRRARERMRYVEPRSAGKVLAHHRYWTPQFLELYIERCDETAFDVPADAYLLAQHLPEIARRIRVGPLACEWATPLEKLGGIVMALAVKGSCCRTAEELEEAALCFDRAFKGLGQRMISTSIMGELHRRYGALLASQGSQEEALAQLETGLEFSTEAQNNAEVADSLVLRGFIRRDTNPAECLTDFIQAARLADLKSPRGRRTAAAANLNTAVLLANHRIPLTDQEGALRLLKQFKLELRGTPTSVRKMNVLWTEARLLSNLKIERHAERQFNKARKGLLRLNLYVDYAVASVELALHHLRADEAMLARKIAAETWGEIEVADSLQGSKREAVRAWSSRLLAAEPRAAEQISQDAHRALLEE